MHLVLLLVCSVMVTACSSTAQTYQYASWENMDYYDHVAPAASEAQ